VHRLIITLGVLGGSVAATVSLLAAPALAHAETDVGPYSVAIGLGSEPAYVGFPNSVEVIIHERASDRGVLTAADTLKATVTFGSRSMPVSLDPNFDEDSGGSPGDYRGAFVPTQPGEYTIHVEGKIDDTPIDETFTSSPTTFDPVTDPATIEFPTLIPTVTELAAKLDREIPRVQALAASRVRSASGSASTAKTLAVVGILVGVMGLGAGAVGLARTRR
jgi:hypothetical protein